MNPGPDGGDDAATGRRLSDDLLGRILDVDFDLSRLNDADVAAIMAVRLEEDAA